MSDKKCCGKGLGGVEQILSDKEKVKDNLCRHSAIEQISWLNSTAQVAMQALNTSMVLGKEFPKHKSSSQSIKRSAKLLNITLKRLNKLVVDK